MGGAIVVLGAWSAAAALPAAVEVDNSLVKARFLATTEGGVAQEFYARSGTGWQPVAVSFRAPQPFPPQGNRLWDVSVDAQRWLANDALTTVAVEKTGDREVQRVRLRGSLRGATIEEVVTLRSGERFFHIEVTAHIPGQPAKLDYLLSTFAVELRRAPELVHTPTLKYDEVRWPGPARDQVLGDRCFHAPAVILQEAGLFCALVPDLTAINAERVLSPDARRRMDVARNAFSVPIEPDKYSMPTALDLNVVSGLSPRPLVSFGMMDYVAAHHIRYLHANDGSMVRALEKPDVRYAFDLLVGADLPPQRGCQEVARHQWQRYGHDVFMTRPHLAMPFAEYMQIVTNVTLKPMGSVHPAVAGFPDTGSFLFFDLQGQPVGGYRSAVPFMVDNLSNSEFWNNVRDAVGMYEWGRRAEDARLLDMARRTIRLALLAPQNERGMFPLNYRAATGRWVRNMFSASSGQNSHLFTHVDQEGDTYNLVAMSKTASHLLQYYERCEQDPRILAYACRYADGLLPLVGSDGAVPSYVAPDGKPYAPLARSAQCATTMDFLAALFMRTRDARHLDAARRVGDYLIREVLPGQRWNDLEQHYSCGNKPLTFTGDTEQGQPARGNLSPLWAASGFAALYRATEDRRYLEAGERCLDYATFSQCCWDPHFIYTAFPFGGFTADNADTATLLDARQAEAVGPLAWYGRTLGRQDLLERAVAAARSSVVLIRHPRHEGANNIYRHPNLYPLGLGPENIDHEGHPQSAMRTSPSWGEGSGVFTGLAEATAQLGGVYVDVGRHVAVGVDGLRVDEATLNGRELRLTVSSMLAKLPHPWDQPYQTELRVVGLADGEYSVLLNGQPAIRTTAAALAHMPITITPEGRISQSERPRP